jgi:D-3-phosphoglycerate dehydrogenase / 2-oxoglutarate reductase
MKVLVADPIAAEGLDVLRAGAQVEVRTGQPPAVLAELLPEFDALIVRSETKVTAELIAAGRRLKIIGRAGVGVDNIDVAAATQHGIMVVNSPQGNTAAAAEHTIALLMALARNIPNAVASMRSGEWKRGAFVGVEVYNKLLGIVGLGNVGREVATRARGLGMRVLAYDPYVTSEAADRLGVTLAELDDLIRRADFLTVHTKLTPENRGMIGDAQFAAMKDGVRVLNSARGGIIDEAALLRALESGKVAGAGLDVFEQEPPPPDSPLVQHPRVIPTPHLGASTQEAQVNVAVDVAEQIVAVLNGGVPRSAVNMPAVPPELLAKLEPYLALAHKLGLFHAQLVDGSISALDVVYSGDLARLEVGPVTRALLMGLLQHQLAETINYVNAPVVAEGRGLRVTESRRAADDDAADIAATITFAEGQRTITGNVRSPRDLRVDAVDGQRIDLPAEGRLIVAAHTDRPGVIGAIGTLLGDHGINIGGMHVGRRGKGTRATMILNVDDPVPDPLLTEIKDRIAAEYVRQVEL